MCCCKRSIAIPSIFLSMLGGFAQHPHFTSIYNGIYMRKKSMTPDMWKWLPWRIYRYNALEPNARLLVHVQAHAQYRLAKFLWRVFVCVCVWVSVRVKWQTTAIHERHVINIKSKENKYCLCKWLSYSVRWKRILDPFSLNEMQTSMIFWHFLCAIDVDYVYEIHATKRAGTNLSNISSVHMIRFRLANGRFTVFFFFSFFLCAAELR